MIELHRHWDVCIRHSTWLELAQNAGLEPQSQTLEEFKGKVTLVRPMSGLNEVLEHFEYLRLIFRSTAILERLAFESVEDCVREGITSVEFRYSPSFLCDQSGLDWQESLNQLLLGFERAQKIYPEISVRLIAIASREASDSVLEKTIQFAIKNQKLFCGIDLAGPENLRPPRTYRELLLPAQKAGLKATIHAGEGTSADHIWQAIDDLGAQRIGHGTSLFEDLQLVEELKKRSICLEMCPTSNWITRAIPSLAEHPISRALRHGVPVSINTDDPAIFDVTLPGEIKIAKNIIGLSDQEVALCQAHALRHRF
jgi:adenosine deaminase